MRLRFTYKLLVIILISVLLGSIFIATTSFADELVSPLKSQDTYKPTISRSSGTINVAAIIVKWLRNIGVIVGVLAVTVIGFNYMLAAAAEDKAKYKETLVPVLIGAIMIVSVLSLIGLIMDMFG